MSYKILVLVLLVATASCQQDEDDGSYNPEKYEKPYENLVDENPVVGEFSNNQIPSAFQQPQQIQEVQPQQQQPLFQQPQNIPASAPLPAQNSFPQNPFPQNPFLRQLQNPGFSQQQQFPTFQQQNPIPQAQSFQQNLAPQNPLPIQQRFQAQPNSFRQPAPVNQFLDNGAPLQSTNYQTDDGHQRSEIVDSDGNVQGQYSYVDPNGKTITVKYSAGKDGFHVEGDHIPRTPQPAAEQPQPQTSLLNQLLPQSNIQFRPQQRRINNPPPQFFNSAQPRSQFNNFPQFQIGAQQQLSQQAPQFDQQSPFSFQPDGTYELQSSFQ